MPTNKELAAEAHALAQKLGKSVRTWRLNNSELQDLVDDLRRQDANQTQSEEPDPEPEDEPAKAPPTTKAPPQADDPQLVVAPGTSLTSARGILGPGTKVSAKDFLGGKATLDELVKAGSVVKG